MKWLASRCQAHYGHHRRCTKDLHFEQYKSCPILPHPPMCEKTRSRLQYPLGLVVVAVSKIYILFRKYYSAFHCDWRSDVMSTKSNGEFTGSLTAGCFKVTDPGVKVINSHIQLFSGFLKSGYGFIKIGHGVV